MQDTSTKFAECDTIEETINALCAEFLQLSPEGRDSALAYIKALKKKKGALQCFPEINRTI